MNEVELFLEKIKEVNVLKLEKDDTLVFEIKSNAPPSKINEYINMFYDRIKPVFPENKILILHDNINIEVIKNEKKGNK